jgi:hypothetical protein
MAGMPIAAETRKLLDTIRLIAIADFLALVPLLIASFSDADGVFHVLGPIHGIGFLALLYLCAKGAGENRWGWWFPALVVVTLGPPGSLIGDLRIRRTLAAQPS